MNSRRKLLIALGAAGVCGPLNAVAQQQTATIHRVGILGSETAAVQADRVAVVRAGLRDLGYIEGKNIVIEFRWAEGKYERLPDLAAELIHLRIDVMVTFGQKAADAAKGATETVPIVVPATTSGLVASLSRPGGNITGGSGFGTTLWAKRMELLKETVPRITKLGMLQNPAESSSRSVLAAMNAAAKSLKLSLQQIDVRGANEFDSVFAAMAQRRVDAVVVRTDTLFAANFEKIANLATKNHLPSISGYREFAEAGGLLSYGVNVLEMYRRMAYYIDKILKGAKPGDLPAEQPTKFELVVNMKTAKALGLKIPDSILVQATKVIE